MKKTTPQSTPVVHCRCPDGSIIDVFPPRSVVDLDNQQDVPAWLLALIAFAPIVDGHVRWSPFSRSVLRQLEATYGDEFLREQLRNVLIDIDNGYRVNNPYGLLVSRCRKNSAGADMIDL